LAKAASLAAFAVSGDMLVGSRRKTEILAIQTGYGQARLTHAIFTQSFTSPSEFASRFQAQSFSAITKA
jgi:hypothetical protein